MERVTKYKYLAFIGVTYWIVVVEFYAAGMIPIWACLGGTSITAWLSAVSFLKYKQTLRYERRRKHVHATRKVS